MPRQLDLAAATLLLLLTLVAVSLLGFHRQDYPPEIYPPLPGVRNWLGEPGAVIAGAILPTFGWGVIALLAAGLTLSSALFRRSSWLSSTGRILGWCLLVPATSLAGEWASGWWIAPLWTGPGGLLGVWLACEAARIHPTFVAPLVLTLVMLLGIQFAARPVPWLCLRGIVRGMHAFGRIFWRELARNRPGDEVVPIEVEPQKPERKIRPVVNLEALHTTEPHEEDDEDSVIPINHHTARSDEDSVVQKTPPLPDLAEDEEVDDDYELPPLDLLDEGTPLVKEAQDRRLLETAALLEQTFLDFGMTVKVVGINTGPVITQFEIALETGLRVNKVTSLTDDIALNLSVTSVRIVAPIPGKKTVGVEIPNEEREDVRLRDVIAAASKKSGRMKIPLYLGKDAEGRPLVQDLADMPHLLIAGRTGTGKSVCMNALIMSMLMTRRPDEVRLLLIDPKGNEFMEYGRVGLPHLMHPVVVDAKKAEAILGWAVVKMEERYELLARARVRNLAAYNELTYDELIRRIKPANDEERRKIPRKLPYIVLIVDEVADLIMQMRKEVEGHIIRLAQKSRAAGIHLIMATQKPTVDVITGLIKSNLPSRICFKVINRSDSRVVLDEGGADKLLGRGDMLFMPPGTSALIRGQGAFASDEEIIRVVEFLATDEPAYVQELLELKTREEKEREAETESGEGPGGQRDAMYLEAIDLVVREGRGSVSMIQSRMGIGYGRAARMVNHMAEDGIVGTHNGSKFREVLLSAEEWAERRERMMAES